MSDRLPERTEGSCASPREVAALFLKLGLIAFGGPAAHVALMRREIVERRRWIGEEEFLRMFAACTLIPGPSSTELAIFLGYRLAGGAGLLLAGVLFILPAMAIMLAVAAAYVHVGSTPIALSALDGIRPVVVAIVAWALWDLSRRVLSRRLYWLLALCIFALTLASVNPILLLALSGAAALLAVRPGWGMSWPALLVVGKGGLSIALLPTVGRLPIVFLTFLKLGAVSYGSGYVLFAFLHSDFVAGLHWLGDRQLVDAVAIGQATPGPVFTTATFLGYLFAGVPGALLATAGIFLPGFCFVPFLDRIVRLVRTHSSASAFLDGVNVGALGLIAGVTTQLAQPAIHDPLTALLALAALPLLIWRPLAAPALIAAGGLVGIVAAGS